MAWLIDTGVLLRLVNRKDPQHAQVRQAVRELKGRQEVLTTTAQNLAEFWNVCTRPAESRGGYGLSVETKEKKLRLLERLFTILPDTAATYPEWRRLAVQHAVKGVRVHDARIVALMIVHGVAQILTLNSADFARYDKITAIEPAALV